MINDYIRREDAKIGLSKTFGRLNADIANCVIDKVEPADVAPVVHAHWIRHENADIICGYYVPSFECSQCGAWKEDDSDFCPDCGAKMDGGELDG